MAVSGAARARIAAIAHATCKPQRTTKGKGKGKGKRSVSPVSGPPATVSEQCRGRVSPYLQCRHSPSRSRACTDRPYSRGTLHTRHSTRRERSGQCRQTGRRRTGRGERRGGEGEG